MPTPTQKFFEVAQNYGQVDPSDPGAVQDWFCQIFPTLPQETIEAILEELLDADGTTAQSECERHYPQGVPLPSLVSSPAMDVPYLASAVGILIALLRRQS